VLKVSVQREVQVSSKVVLISKVIRAALIGITIGLIVNACTTEAIRFSHHHDYNDEELIHYVDLVKLVSKDLMLPETGRIGFKNNITHILELERGILGTCNFVIPSMEIDIDIDKNLWKMLTYYEKLLLVAHELRHCVCVDIGHPKTETFDDGCPKHYMNAYSPGIYCSREHFNHYIQQIAKGCSRDNK
jgi:hypothetical protein